MRVIDAPLQVVFIADRVLPIPLLPDTALPMLLARYGLWQFGSASSQPSLGKLFFDPHPTQGITVITGGQNPNGMPMIGQQHDGEEIERMVALDFLNRLAKTATSDVRRENRLPLVGDAGEEICPARHKVPSEVRHVVSRRVGPVRHGGCRPTRLLLTMVWKMVGRRSKRAGPTLRLFDVQKLVAVEEHAGQGRQAVLCGEHSEFGELRC